MYGLSSEQALDSREHNGSNALAEVQGKKFLLRYFEHFRDPIIQILLMALLISVIFSVIGTIDWIETIGIFIAIATSTVVSSLSEGKADQVFKKLGKQASEITVGIYRDGVLSMFPIDEVVVDDCIKVQWGDRIPADGILLSGDLSIDASDLTGESQEEQVATGQELLRSSIVKAGEGIVKITQVGENTVYGKIAKEVQIERNEGPLYLKLKKLAKQISIFAYVGAFTIAVAYICKSIMFVGIDEYFAHKWLLFTDLTHAITLAIVIIVMAVPEGLPLMVAIVSSLNMRRMLKDNILVRTMSAVETAGSLNILFSDKTGTITKGQLECVIFIDSLGHEFANFDDIPPFLADKACQGCTLNSSAEISQTKEGRQAVGGNATERALLMFFPYNVVHDVVKLRQEVFDSQKKFSSCEIKRENSDIMLVKGAPEIILKKCTRYYSDNGENNLLDNISHLEEKMTQKAGESIRLIALAECESANGNLPDDNCILVGILGVKNEVREESISAISEIKNAGVQVVMITGDRRETAVAIAKEVGLLTSDDDVVLTSEELGHMSDEEIKEKIPRLRIIARALPNDKSRLVKLSRELNLVVGMTGDGVNDTPALKRADIGFAMGSGTEAAKEAGGIVILDDNFLSIKKSVLYGRTIYNNIKKFIAFQLTLNISAVAISFISPFVGIEFPLTVVQILWLNLLSDSLIAIAFGSEPADENYMNEKPKSRAQNIISSDTLRHFVVMGSYITIVSILYFTVPFFKYMTRFSEDGIVFYTAYFSFFVFAVSINAFNNRTDNVNILKNINKNPVFIYMLFGIVVVQFIISQFAGIFMRTAPLTFSEWLAVILLSLTVIPIDMLRKSFYLK